MAVEPRSDSRTFRAANWPSLQFAPVSDGTIRLMNNTSAPIQISKNDHLCQVRGTHTTDITNIEISTPRPKNPVVKLDPPYSKHVVIDPNNQLSNKWRAAFSDLHLSYDSVFEDRIGRYNDKSGKVRARINLGANKPPTRKIRCPTYDKNNLDALQDKFDELEGDGVMCRPEDVGIVVEHVSPSFLVNKSKGGFRLVTNFTSLIDYCKTLPTIMPTVESVLQTIGSWEYIIITDLKDAFYQIPMERSSMKYCATQTPYRGLRVYVVAVQGLPGSSEALEEMLCAVLGEYVKEGIIAKIADDLTVGGSSIENLFHNWMRILDALAENGLKLKGPKTVIAPSKTQILGWMWNNGTITACIHKISPLTTCKPPETVTALRSYVGAFKVFNRIIRGCAGYLSDLDKFMSGKQKNEKLIWNESMLVAFTTSQAALSKAAVVALPKPSDQLIIVHDGSTIGIGSVLYLKRGNYMKLGGFFSAKLKVHQKLWYPCELEALSIASSVSHFSPYIIQSHHRSQILTDNRPCVQAWSKMKRGEFSSSARVGTFMSILSQYDVDVQFIKGEFNLPSDFQSRHPPNCEEQCCQICKFVNQSDDVVVRKTSVEAVLAGREQVPFTTRASWKSLQLECQDLRRVHAHLIQGTRPTAKKSKSTVVKRFLRNAKIGRDGLLVVKQARPFLPETELIIVPLSILHGLLTSLHLQLGHPTATQLINVFNRSYFSLNVNDCVNHVLQACSQCQALKTIPRELCDQTSTVQTTTLANNFAADVLRRYGQKIFVMRETLSSFTITSLVNDETHDSLRSAIVEAASSIRANPQTVVTIRLDNATGLAALKNDLMLQTFNIVLDFGRIHNKNKNPVIEKAIQELGGEMLRYSSSGGPFTSSELAYITNILNSRLRHHGLSAWEIMYQRNQYSGEQIEVNDLQLAEEQMHLRVSNQQYSAKCKAQGKPPAVDADIRTGSIVYIKGEGDKTKSRERYIVVNVVGDSCTLRKLTKSQLRSKPYQLKLSEIYPVSSELPTEYYSLPTGDSDSDSEVCVDTFQSVDSTANSVVPLVDNVNDNTGVEESSEPVNAGIADVSEDSSPPMPVSAEDLDATVAYDFDVAAVSDEVSYPDTRRSKRASKEPSWMRSGDYVVSHGKRK